VSEPAQDTIFGGGGTGGAGGGGAQAKQVIAITPTKRMSVLAFIAHLPLRWLSRLSSTLTL
jgi:hypothetical protein